VPVVLVVLVVVLLLSLDSILRAAVEKEILSRGYRPIANLTGHGLDQYVAHMDPTIPNISIHGGTLLEEGMAIAIEPFATTGSGRVGAGPEEAVDRDWIAVGASGGQRVTVSGVA